MRFYFLCLFLFLGCFYPMKEESKEFEFNQSEIDFLEFLKEKYADTDEENILISLTDSTTNEAKAVIQFFDSYIKAFESHRYCSRKCVGEIQNEVREDYVILSPPNKKESRSSLECYYKLPPQGKKEFFFSFEGDRICDSIEYEETKKYFPVPNKDENGEYLNYKDEKGNIIMLYEDNAYQEKKCYIVKDTFKNFDHSTCKKEKCKNEGVDRNYGEYDKNQPCAMINGAGMCCWIIDNAELYSLRLTDLPFYSFIKMIDGINHAEKDVIQIDILKIKELGIFDQIAEQKSFNFFIKKCLKRELFNKKNIAFGSLIGCFFYRYSFPQVKKRNALVGGLTAYGGASLVFAYMNRGKKLIFDQKSLKKKTELY